MIGMGFKGLQKCGAGAECGCCQNGGSCSNKCKAVDVFVWTAAAHQAGNRLISKGWSGCSSHKKCGKCRGDCDSDNDCKHGLKCFQRNHHEHVPGCAAGGKGDKSGYDYCYKKPSRVTRKGRMYALGRGKLCPKSDYIKSKAECLCVNKLLGLRHTNHFWHGSYHRIPTGCSRQVGWGVHWNTKPGG